jgi:hypothetical protein
VRVKFGHGRSSIETPGTVRGRDVVMAGIVAITARDARLRRARTRSSDIYNWGSGVEVTRRVRVVDSDLTFVISPEPPKLVRSTCEHSVVSGTRATWGICTSD